MSDPLSITAGAVGLIQFGLKSLKVTHEILSGFKDGPKTVTQAITDVKHLTTILTELSTCRAVREDGGEHIRKEIATCLDEILAFGRSVQTLKQEAGEGMGTRWRKKFSALWREKALSKTSARLLSQMQGLNLHLNALQSDTLGDIPTRIDQLSRDLTAQQDTAASKHRAHLVQNTAALTAVETRLAHHGSGITTMQAAVRQGFSDTATGQQELMSALGTGQQELMGMVGTGQQEIMGMLAQMLAAQMSLANPPFRASPSSHEPPGTQRPPPSQLICQDLVNLIERLCSSVSDSNLQPRAARPETRQITDLLLSAVELMRSNPFQQTFLDSQPEKRICLSCVSCGRHHLEQLRDSLNMVYGSLLSSRAIVVNDVVAKRPQSSCSIILRDQSKFWTYRQQSISLTLSSLTRQLKPLHDADKSDQSLDGSEEVVVRLVAISGGPGTRRAMSLNIRQVHGPHGVFSHVPNLSVHNVLPAGSLVFDLVRQGRTNELQALLRQGKASLRDQDEYGASLLHYAMGQPEMCRFLLKSGADIDHVASRRGVHGGSDVIVSALYPNHRIPVYRATNDPEILEPFFLCRRYLLDAGCDPTIPTVTADGYQWLSGFEELLATGYWEAVKQVLDHGSSFIDIEARGNDGRTAIQTACYAGGGSAEVFDILLRRGANLRKVDDRGNSCLHLYMMSPWLYSIDFLELVVPATMTRMADAIIFLVRNGADVRAINQDGQSVSDMAKVRSRYNFDKLGSMRGDVWDFCLTSCGYIIDDIRPGYVRKGCYVDDYSRKDFERLWAGKEHLCPYFNDVEDREESGDTDEWTDVSSSDEDGGDEAGDNDSEDMDD